MVNVGRARSSRTRAAPVLRVGKVLQRVNVGEVCKNVGVLWVGCGVNVGGSVWGAVLSEGRGVGSVC